MSSISHDELQHIRVRLGQARGPQYWRSLEELAESESFGEFLNQISSPGCRLGSTYG
ncbi:TAT-variant-translocated molybdopterin oxidoreductase [Modicisalibacter luteus]|uniref:TAT-variant-translocated molybdopterin oxidoreductase n=1 Tax=Modicisalibacter luteus TaxID=453962 RepID=UPI003623035D